MTSAATETAPEVICESKTDALRQAGWTYKGCGYWIDPKTGVKHMTDNAFDLLGQRQALQARVIVTHR